MSICLVETPRANANEDELQVIEVLAYAGQTVAADDLLFVLETTKAAVEVLAPRAGVVRNVRAKVGSFVAVGAPLCELAEIGGSVETTNVSNVATLPQTITITAKARRTADELGIDLTRVVPVDGRIGEAEVRAARPAPQKAERRWAAIGPKLRRAVIMGGGGHAACLIDALQGSGFTIVGCVDRSIAPGTPVAAGVAILGNEDMLENLHADGIHYAFIGVGGADDSRTRRILFERLTAIGFEIPAIVHPTAIVAGDVGIGAGCHILAGATVGARSTIGENVIVNQGGIVCHDCTLHDHVHITPGAILAGNVTVGPRSVIGMGSTVLLGVTIGADCLIHNGTHLVADVADSTIVDATGQRTRRPAVSEL